MSTVKSTPACYCCGRTNARAYADLPTGTYCPDCTKHEGRKPCSEHVALGEMRAQIDDAKRARIELIQRALRERLPQRSIAAAAGVSLSVVSKIAKTVRSEQAAS